MLDRIIRGGSVVDGTGNPQFVGDIGIKDGSIVAVGVVKESASSVVDADGLVVAPGFVDMHTHLDAQIMWDPALTPSSLHGVTTVIGGNCGFGIAPVDETTIDYIVNMLAAVEGMPPQALEAGLNPNWRSYAEWTSQLEGKSSLNFGFLAAHSPIRRLVMGESWQRAATSDEITKMAEHVDATVAAGALGFSSSWNDIHLDHEGVPVPSRFAEPEELAQLSAVLRGYPGTVIGFQAGSKPRFSQRSIDAMADMSAAAGRPLNWNALTVGTGVDEAAIRERLTASDYAAARGGSVYALLNPTVMKIRMTPQTMNTFNTFPEWAEIMALPPTERIRAFKDPVVRQRLASVLAGKTDLRRGQRVETLVVESVVNDELRPLEGRALTDIAAERGCTVLEAFLDIAVADQLRCYFYAAEVEGVDEAWRFLASLLADDQRTVVGGTDAGAHLDSLDSFTMFTDLVGFSVRERELVSLERAVHLITDGPAKFCGLKNRGRLAPGFAGDVVLFDPDEIAPDKTGFRPDMPGGYSRIYADALGIKRVIVNGVDVVVDGAPTGSQPGSLLHSARDLSASR